MRALRTFTVESVFSGVERMLRVVVEEADGRVLRGGEWHATLLREAAARSPNGRPPIIGAETFELLDDLRRFRHVARHHYGLALDEDGIEENVAVMRRLLPLLETDLRAFEAAMTGDAAPP